LSGKIDPVCRFVITHLQLEKRFARNYLLLHEWDKSKRKMGQNLLKTNSVDIAVPDFSTLSRRGKRLVLPPRKPTTRPSGPVHLVVNSTGLL
jgi:hypothetical protein